MAPAEIPELVRQAERRARALGFAQSCELGVGRLLAVLAAGVRPRGRVLEIGTGVGYGTAWLVSGLVDRDDVEVFSIELNPNQLSAVIGDPWPQTVHFIAGDVLERFDSLGTFSLVFADAQGGKWERLDRTIDALEPGGLLVVDDMNRPTVEVVADQRSRTEAVRATLLADPRLLVVELDWSTGVMLARRRAGDPRSDAIGAGPERSGNEPH